MDDIRTGSREHRRLLRDRRTRELMELLGRRGELRGVNEVADHFAEGFAWSV